MKVIIVEDEEVVAELLSELVKRLNPETLTVCDSGEEALPLISQIRPDLIITDFGLRGALTGIDVVRQATQNGCKFCLMVSGSVSDKLSERTHFDDAKDAAGEMTFWPVKKPFDISEMLDRLQAIETELERVR